MAAPGCLVKSPPRARSKMTAPGTIGTTSPGVPGAVIFDLARGGDFTKHPGAAMGREAYDAALSTTSGAPLMGVVGAGTGAVAGGLKGAVGSASVVLADGTTAVSYTHLTLPTN